MKARLTMRAALALGLPSLKRGIWQMRRASRALLSRAGHEARQGNMPTAALLAALYFAGP